MKKLLALLVGATLALSIAVAAPALAGQPEGLGDQCPTDVAGNGCGAGLGNCDTNPGIGSGGVDQGNFRDCTPTPTPTDTPSPTVPPVVSCPGSAVLGPWHGDPLINITLTGEGSFLVTGGKFRRSNVHQYSVALACGATVVVRRYHVMVGSTVRVYLDGVLVASKTAPALNA